MTTSNSFDIISSMARNANSDERALRQAEHTKITKRLERAISKALAATVAAGTLAEKIEAKAPVKGLREELRLHRLNYYAFLDGVGQ